ncbi:MAG TPA: type I glyceraldehyde-3-phosphate dehydrogenase [Patescibacteria group bacterium]|nr:type I glyceraldehyde-3-phosphate dehydrogenase [Patescibacteria group bacterium]
MKTKVAINGFGRIGRNAFKVAFERSDLEVVAINDISDARTLAYLLKHDTTYGTYGHKVTYNDENIIVDEKAIKVLKQADPALLPWGDLGVDIVIEATGYFSDPVKAKAHIDSAGAKKVVISAPAKGEGADTIIIGVNEDSLKTSGDIISVGSCTTNCVTPVLDILNHSFGIEKALMTTVHSYTADQRLQDAPNKELRTSRAASENIIPANTGASATAVKVLPELDGKINSLSVRVPTSVVSLADFAVDISRQTSVEEVNGVFKKAAADAYYQGILAVTDEELVSSDFIGNSHSAIIDLNLTNVVGGNLVKVLAWYDNEWGHSNRLIELVADVGRLLNTGDTKQNYPEPEEAHIS